jgi:hypothetical protein
MKRATKIIEGYGLPGRDLYELPTSPLTFPDGANYRIEISGIERPEVCEAVLDESEKRGVPVHRLISMVMGSTLLDKKELREFAQLAHDGRVEVIVTPGPRAAWDIGRQITTPEGAMSGMRFRGSDAVAQYIEEVLRCVEAGFRGFLVWDEGVLWLLNRMREDGNLPRKTVFKLSIYAGQSNPCGAKVIEELGADTFNPVADLTLPALAAIRKACKIPIDLHIYLADTWGGFNRMREAAELARICSPCYFKIEPGPTLAGLYKPWTSKEMLKEFAREKMKYGEIIKEIIDENEPSLRLSDRGPSDLAIPEP